MSVRDKDTMLGREYPFFLSNDLLGEFYYSYQFYSPGVSDNFMPLVSLTKVNEKVDRYERWGVNEKNEPLMLPWGKDDDILRYLSGSQKQKKQMGSFFKTIIKRDGMETYSGSKGEFPAVEMVFGERNSLQKSIIIYLRDLLRWKSYRFQAGRKIDLLYSPTEFVVFEFKETADHELYIEPVAAYKNYDVEMKRPLKVDFNSISYPKGVWSKDKFSEMNKSFKLFEWESFNKKELAPRVKRS